ncbi:hypothetical protein ACJX0J_013898, partial [Zea mays]
MKHDTFEIDTALLTKHRQDVSLEGQLVRLGKYMMGQYGVIICRWKKHTIGIQIETKNYCFVRIDTALLTKHRQDVSLEGQLVRLGKYMMGQYGVIICRWKKHTIGKAHMVGMFLNPFSVDGFYYYLKILFEGNAEALIFGYFTSTNDAAFHIYDLEQR